MKCFDLERLRAVHLIAINDGRLMDMLPGRQTDKMLLIIIS